MQSLRTCLNSVRQTASALSGGSAARSFSSTPATLAKSSRHRLETMLADVPPYPYEIKSTFKQHWFGLYGGRHIIHGNKVSEKDEKKHRRSWKPNLKHTSLYSETLGRMKVKVCVGVLRTIDKVGGLDNYLLGSTPARVKELGPFGWALRWKVLKQKAARGELPKNSPIYGIFGMTPKESAVENKKAAPAAGKTAEAPVENLSIPETVPQGAVTL
ncbi:hypothetical protein BJ508DRAFT_411410 [Ascobolus immersus RN42]|uniref:Large ribosomal subunit protein bL28m n=1 Tax=Ascobolus immersus RN42 TaxID=1160509 RepID=A0A3N4ILD9_ASCIM|nr:hypothetical protein BJ508DRAFT_411410 [Ascobolus immersus RN42]